MKQLLKKLSNLFGTSKQTELESDESELSQGSDSSFAETYSLVQSPYHDPILALLKKIVIDAQSLSDSDDQMAVDNALYCAVVKRMSKREYDGDDKAYLAGLISDVSGGKYEFSQVCYDNGYASDAFRELNMGLTLWLAQVGEK